MVDTTTTKILRSAEAAHAAGDRTEFVVWVTRFERAATGRLSSIGRVGSWVDAEDMMALDWDDVADLLAEAADGAAMEIAEGRS